ncbi:hypothetical protein, unlikely [Trypanosoma brucei gambiense DAL972]|uniref:Uncharacterized protein n=1 Tax=Trypanosoma brucei gambiense (strain MHOM/CI/86/DAL972) TaxID=679716 RepID=C9ZWS1_TRYB9|nr:hypothetical protein, unlikely [Trypanosoma brucei gambiense DAL972]CBH13860.1 hypothetical protein, unlikely [Trypanosoma brucei gambiense DAL972]|eukprot:XP_011776136.1 hypothetical protein, unlikely [Trypanosoma brucei gambiense DAL972]
MWRHRTSSISDCCFWQAHRRCSRSTGLVIFPLHSIHPAYRAYQHTVFGNVASSFSPHGNKLLRNLKCSILPMLLPTAPQKVTSATPPVKAFNRILRCRPVVYRAGNTGGRDFYLNRPAKHASFPVLVLSHAVTPRRYIPNNLAVSMLRRNCGLIHSWPERRTPARRRNGGRSWGRQ